METQKELTCAERVKPAWQNCRETIRMMLNPDPDDVELVDDGTLDTVLRLDDREYRYSDSSDYRDDDGKLDLESFVADNMDEIKEDSFERFSEYGLSFDYVEPGTFQDQKEGYFRYQICWGGPSEEIRFYIRHNDIYSSMTIEFWFLDWFDGDSIDVTNDDIAQLVWQEFECFASELVGVRV